MLFIIAGFQCSAGPDAPVSGRARSSPRSPSTMVTEPAIWPLTDTPPASISAATLVREQKPSLESTRGNRSAARDRAYGGERRILTSLLEGRGDMARLAPHGATSLQAKCDRGKRMSGVGAQCPNETLLAHAPVLRVILLPSRLMSASAAYTDPAGDVLAGLYADRNEITDSHPRGSAGLHSCRSQNSWRRPIRERCLCTRHHVALTRRIRISGYGSPASAGLLRLCRQRSWTRRDRRQVATSFPAGEETALACRPADSGG